MSFSLANTQLDKKDFINELNDLYNDHGYFFTAFFGDGHIPYNDDELLSSSGLIIVPPKIEKRTNYGDDFYSTVGKGNFTEYRVARGIMETAILVFDGDLTGHPHALATIDNACLLDANLNTNWMTHFAEMVVHSQTEQAPMLDYLKACIPRDDFFNDRSNFINATRQSNLLLSSVHFGLVG